MLGSGLALEWQRRFGNLGCSLRWRRASDAQTNLGTGSEEIAMYRRRLAHMMLATLCLGACLTFFGACVAIVHAQAQDRSSADQTIRQLSPYHR
jgi:hypothetical protein